MNRTLSPHYRMACGGWLWILSVVSTLVMGAHAQITYTPYNFRTLAGLAPNSGSADGTGRAAQFWQPSGVAADSAGNVYVADSGNNTIRKMTPSGVVTTLAGLAGNPGSADGTNSKARFYNPNGLAVDSAGNVYVADTYNNTIRKVTPAGLVSTVAGRAGVPGSADGTNGTARFNGPAGVAVDSAGNIYVADTSSCTIRKVTPNGVVTTLAGLAGNYGSADGTNNTASFLYPSGATVDSAGNVYVADTYNNTIRRVTPNGVVTTLAGLAGKHGSDDGTNSAARFYNPSGVAVDGAGNIYVADRLDNTIRKVTPSGLVTTLAGYAGLSGTALGSEDGTNGAARFYNPSGVSVDKFGNVYVADSGNNTIRRVTTTGVVTTLAGPPGSYGSADGPIEAARFNYPEGVAVDGAHNVYVADSLNDTIRKVTPDGYVTTLAGFAGNPGSADGTNSAARFLHPSAVAVDRLDNVYVADTYNNTIRKMTPDGIVTTLAGLAGTSGSADGTNIAAQFNRPQGLAVDSEGNIYVADSLNDTIRKVTTNGVVTTLAGLAGNPGSADGTNSTARFSDPSGVAVDRAGNVYVANSGNFTIRKVTPTGVVTTLAGLASIPGSADGTNSAARFYWPLGVAVDSADNIFVADSGNYTIRKVTTSGVVTTLGGMAGVTGVSDGAGISAQFGYPFGVAVDSSGNLYVADSSNNSIRSGINVYARISVSLLSSGDLSLSFMGAGGSSYVLEETSTLTPPIHWIPQATNQANAAGGLGFTNTPISGANSFWRIRTH